MTLKSTLCIILATFLFIGCKKDRTDETQPVLFCGTPYAMTHTFDYFAFGKVYGFCPSSCGRFYKIEDGQLFKDSMSNYNGPLVFSVTPLPASKWQLAMQVINMLPLQVLSDTDTTYGMPDSHDQGVIVIEYKRLNVVKRCFIDPDTTYLPAAMKPYAQEIESVLSQL